MCSFGSQQSAPTNQFTTQTVTASPQAQAMFNQAWQQAQSAAARPFQPYSQDPSAFVAQLNPTQLQAIGNIAGYQGAADPYYQMAGGLAGRSGMTTTPQVVSQYMSPYMSQVIDPTRQAIEQQQGMQRSQLTADQIKAGAFGQERGQLARAVLAGQQNLGLGQALSPLYQTGYGQALQGAQTDLARQLQAAQTLGGIGSGYQQAGLQGAQALLGAGTLGQQTQQAGLQKLYDQFLMQQQYPFMASQFLTQAAAGLGPGYGGTTSGFQTSQQPLSFMGNPLSDPSLKTGAHDEEEPEVIGETKDGQKIYRYRLINPETGELGPAQIGLMADEVEERNPEAVGDYKGFRTVDYAKATDDAARMGGGVKGPGDYADGGGVDDSIGGILKSQQESFKGFGAPSSGLFQPQAIQSAKLEPAELSYAAPAQKKKSSLAEGLEGALGLYKGGKEAYGTAKEALGTAKEAGSFLGLGSLLGGLGSAGGTIGAAGGVPVAVMGGLGGTAVPTFGAAAASAAPGIFSTLASLLPFALSDPKLKTGVRPNFADGGASDYSDDDIGRFLSSIAKIETGGTKDPYSVVGPHTKYGDPLGKYQVVESNLPQWSKQAGLGQLSREEFLGNKEAQEAVARSKYGEYLAKTGDPEAAAAMWFSGPGYKKHPGARDVLGTSIPEYQARFRKGLGEPSGETVDLKGLSPQSRAFQASTVPEEGKTVSVPSEAGPKPEGLSGFLRGTAPEGAGEKALDFATSERFIVPLLTGLGAMASSGSRYLAPSILQGLGAGAKAYMEVPKIQAETQKIAEEAKVQAQEALAKKVLTGKMGVETQRLATELYEKQYVPNVGWMVYDKTKPYSVPKRITDAEGNQLGPISPQDIPTKAGTAAPEPEKHQPKVASALDWKPTLEAPSGHKIPGSYAAYYSGDLPKQQASAEEEIKKLRAESEAANMQLYRLAEMEHQFQDLPERGFLQPGSYADLRTQTAREINTLVTMAGGKPLFDQNNLAAAEELGKDTKRLGFETSKAMGHEPGFIVQSAVSANPGMENTAVGFQRIVAGLKEAAKYQQDRLAFYENYKNRYQTTAGADQLFRKLNPPEAYVRRAVLSTIRPEDLQAIKASSRQDILSHEGEIDKTYGKGTTKLILGEE